MTRDIDGCGNGRSTKETTCSCSSRVNNDTKEFFERGVRGDLPTRAPGRYAGSFAIGTMEEFGEAVTDNKFAFFGMEAFFAWGLSELSGEQSD